MNYSWRKSPERKYYNDPKFSDIQLQANIVDPDQEQSEQGLHCLPFRPIAL